MNNQKSILAIHDISCVGKCSLTVALPIISACGMTVDILPTAVLSTHTGGFTEYTFRDLSTDIMPIVNHWKKLGLTFDGIYTGYLGDISQVDMVKNIIDMFKTADTTVIVDPVMGDHGKLYAGFDDKFASEMASLCKKADIIIPNLTEANYILGKPHDEFIDTNKAKEILLELSKYSNASVVMTGVVDKNNIGAGVYDKDSGSINFALSKRIEGIYHGTGDVFGSVLTAMVSSGKSIHNSASIACEFTQKAIQLTSDAKTDFRYGVQFERCLPWLINNCL